MTLFIQGMHQTRTFMPPFPGTEKEAQALVAYLQQLRAHPQTLPGAQSAGIVIAPAAPAPAMTAATSPTR